MTIFGRTFNEADFRRVAWAAVQAGTAALAVLAPGFWKAPNMKTAAAMFVAFIVAAGAAAFSAVKNWFLADTSSLK